MGGKSGSQTTTSQATVPDFLQPFIQNATSTAGGALNNISDLTQQNPGGFVAPFNPNQLAGQQSAIDVAGGAGGFIPQAQQVFSEAAGGSVIDQLAPGAIQNLQRLGQGGGALSGFANNPFQLNNTSNQALQQSANGDFLFGNAGFDEAVQASIRAATPGLNSTFAGAGSGGLKSGLADVGRQQVASDAFARLFDSERNRQVGAASQLGGFQLAGQQQQIGAAGADQSSQLGATNSLSHLLETERGRQLQAAGALPGVGLLEADILNSVGGIQQGQGQRELEGPIAAQMGLLNAANAQIPLNSLIGQSTTQPTNRNRGAGALGGGIQGFQLGTALGGPVGGTIGAIGGGLLGAFG